MEMDFSGVGPERASPLPRMTFATQFVAIVKKNVLLKLGAKKQLAYEMCVPHANTQARFTPSLGRMWRS